MNQYSVSAAPDIEQRANLMAVDMTLTQACKFAQERSEKHPFFVYRVINQRTDYVAVTFTCGIGDA